MLSTVWRVADKNFDVDDFLNKFGLRENAVVFYQGEEARPGRRREESGFNISISENLISSEHINEVNVFLMRNKEAFDYLVDQKITSVFDIGCTVGTCDQFTMSVNVPCELLASLASLKVSLEFSAYPASDEKQEE